MSAVVASLNPACGSVPAFAPQRPEAPGLHGRVGFNDGVTGARCDLHANQGFGEVFLVGVGFGARSRCAATPSPVACLAGWSPFVLSNTRSVDEQAAGFVPADRRRPRSTL